MIVQHNDGDIRLEIDDANIGRQLDDYRLEALLGQGGMASVYQAVHVHQNHRVAIKLLHAHLNQRLDCRKRLKREYESLVAVHHPVVIEAIDYVDNRQHAYMVTELVKGRTLKSLVCQSSLERWPELGAYIVMQVASALHVAHDMGILHRDIKPDNIMLDDDGRVRLLDFGIADNPDATALTQTGTIIGSPAHIAPEVVASEEATTYSDIYALGTVLYWLTTGQLPFPQEAVPTVLKHIVDGDYPDPATLNPTVINPLAQVINTAMSLDSTKRFPNMQALYAACHAACAPFHAVAGRYLASWCTQPDMVERSWPSIAKAYLSEAEAAIHTSEMTTAVAYLNRVLIEDPENEKAQTLLTSQLSKSHAVDEQNYDSDTTQRDVISQPLRQRLQVWQLALIPLLFGVGLFAYRAQRVSEEASATAQIKTVAVESQISRMDQPQTVIRRVDDVNEPENQESPSVESERLLKQVQKAPSRKRKKTLRPSPPKINMSTKTLPVTMVANTYVDWTIDGKLVARDKRIWKGLLTKGQHQLRLSHAGMKTIETDVLVKDDEQQRFNFKMTGQPARLRVHTNVNADVAISKLGRAGPQKINVLGRAEQSMIHPFKIRLEDSGGIGKYEILISEQGYRPVRFVRQLKAGEVVNLDVDLQQDGTR